MMCTAAAIISLLGYMPPPGTTITVPRSAINKYTVTQQLKAKVCAKRHGILYVIDGNK